MNLSKEKKNVLKNRLIQGISWLVVIGIFLYVLASITPSESAPGVSFWGRIGLSIKLLGESLSQAHLGAMIGLVLVYMTYLIFWESSGTRWVINRFNCSMSIREMVPARAVTFLLAIFNYQAGQLALPLYLKRIHQVPLQEGMGSIFFIAAIDLCIVFMMGTLGALFIEEGMLANQILFFGLLGIFIFILNALFWRWPPLSQWVMKVFQKLPFLNRLNQERSIFYTFQKATLKDYLITFFFRAPIHFGIIFSLYLLILCFKEQIDFLVILIYMPVVMIVSTIPIINVGSVGAAQASIVYFFKEFAPEATLLAIALSWAFAINLMKVIIGAFFLNKHSTELFRKE